MTEKEFQTEVLDRFMKLELVQQEFQMGVNARFDRLDQKVDGLDQKVDGLDQKVDGLDQKVDGLDKEVGGLDQKVDGLDQKVDGLKVELKKGINFLYGKIITVEVKVDRLESSLNSPDHDI